MRALLFTALLASLWFSGCGQGGSGNPYVMGHKSAGQPPAHNPYAAAIVTKSTEIEKAKIDAQVKKELAKIDKEKAVEVQKVKSETALSRAETDKEIALKQLEVKEKTLAEEHRYNLMLLAIAAAVVVLLFVFLFYNSHKKRKLIQEEQERERLLKLQMQEQELKMQMAKEMLGTLSSDKISAEHKTRLIETIRHTTAGHLIEHKP